MTPKFFITRMFKIVLSGFSSYMNCLHLNKRGGKEESRYSPFSGSRMCTKSFAVERGGRPELSLSAVGAASSVKAASELLKRSEEGTPALSYT